eukprot:1584022-Lingulodinium_polyedra.AAC.1
MQCPSSTGDVQSLSPSRGPPLSEDNPRPPAVPPPPAETGPGRAPSGVEDPRCPRRLHFNAAAI